MKLDLRSVPRYFLNPPVPGFANGRAIRLVDLSTKGARLELVEPFEPGEQLFLQIVSASGELTVEGTILWCEIDSLLMDMVHDSYLVGVAFARTSETVNGLLDALCGKDQAIRIEDFRDHDRYHITAPLTGSFGDIAPVSLLDISLRGVRISSLTRIAVGTGANLRFQVDGESGPTDVFGKVVWTTPGANGETQAGLLISNEDEQMRRTIHRLCVLGEARIDVDSLRRKFDQLRAAVPRQKVAG